MALKKLLDIADQIHPLSIFAAFILSTCDMVLTVIVCSRIGFENERNFAFKWALKRGGSKGLTLMWSAFWVLAILLYRDSSGIWLVMIALFIFAIAHNSIVLVDDIQTAKENKDKYRQDL